MIYIGNAFSLQMMQNGTIDIELTDVETVAKEVEKHFPVGKVTFCIGHQDTANVARNVLMNAMPNNWFELTTENVFKRVNVSLESGDILYVLQVVGGRLPEGCTELPEGIQLSWRKVTVR